MSEFDSSSTIGSRNLSELMAEHASSGKKPFISIEFFPPKTPEGITSLFEVLEKLKVYSPLFADVTWGAGGTTSDLTLQLCKQVMATGVTPNMHLTCTNSEPALLNTVLESCKAAGIKNILALRGDPPLGQTEWKAHDTSLSCALDLVTLIRSKYANDDFSIAVAGYPEGHPSKMQLIEGGVDSLTASEKSRYSTDVDEATGATLVYVCRDADYAGELAYLKKKVDAGASLIVTQMFFDVEVFISFVKDCRAVGITVPILPGIMCVSAYGGFKRMAKFCKTRVPEVVSSKLESIKEDEAAVRAFGIEFGVQMCRRLVEGGAPGLHFYTLNSSVVTRAIIEEIRDIVSVPPLIHS